MTAKKMKVGLALFIAFLMVAAILPTPKEAHASASGGSVILTPENPTATINVGDGAAGRVAITVSGDSATVRSNNIHGGDPTLFRNRTGRNIVADDEIGFNWQLDFQDGQTFYAGTWGDTALTYTVTAFFEGLELRLPRHVNEEDGFSFEFPLDWSIFEGDTLLLLLEDPSLQERFGGDLDLLVSVITIDGVGLLEMDFATEITVMRQPFDTFYFDLTEELADAIFPLILHGFELIELADAEIDGIPARRLVFNTVEEGRQMVYKQYVYAAGNYIYTVQIRMLQSNAESHGQIFAEIVNSFTIDIPDAVVQIPTPAPTPRPSPTPPPTPTPRATPRPGQFEALDHIRIVQRSVPTWLQIGGSQISNMEFLDAMLEPGWFSRVMSDELAFVDAVGFVQNFSDEWTPVTVTFRLWPDEENPDRTWNRPESVEVDGRLLSEDDGFDFIENLFVAYHEGPYRLTDYFWQNPGLSTPLGIIYIPITAEELQAHHDNNRMRFEDNFMDRYVTVTGVIDSIGANEVFLFSRVVGQWSLDENTIPFRITDAVSRADIIDNFSIGDTITLYGRVRPATGMWNFDFLIDNARTTLPANGFIAGARDNYNAFHDLVERGAYLEAFEIIEILEGNFRISAERVILEIQTEYQAAAVELLEHGLYLEAYEILHELSNFGFGDIEVLKVYAQTAISYVSAHALLDISEYLEAAAAFDALGDFRDSAEMAILARQEIYAIALAEQNEAQLVAASIEIALSLYLDLIQEISADDIWFDDAGSMLLIYIDDDDIPELLIDWGFTAGGSALYTVSDGELVYIRSGSGGHFSYIERGNLIRDGGGRMDRYHDIIYTIQDGEFVELHRGAFGEEGNPDWDETVEDSPMLFFYWRWDEEDVSELEYEENLFLAFDSSIAISPWNDAVSADEMIEIIIRMLGDDTAQIGTASFLGRQTVEEFLLPLTSLFSLGFHDNGVFTHWNYPWPSLNYTPLVYLEFGWQSQSPASNWESGAAYDINGNLVPDDAPFLWNGLIAADFKLYDIGGEAPVILIWYIAESYGINIMYEFIDGQYRGREDLHLAHPTFFTDGQGRIVMAETEYGDATVSFFVEGEEGMERDVILDWTEWYEFESLFDFDNPTIPGMPNEPLVHLLPLDDLRDEIITSMRQNHGLEPLIPATTPAALNQESGVTLTPNNPTATISVRSGEAGRIAITVSGGNATVRSDNSIRGGDPTLYRSRAGSNIVADDQIGLNWQAEFADGQTFYAGTWMNVPLTYTVTATFGDMAQATPTLGTAPRNAYTIAGTFTDLGHHFRAYIFFADGRMQSVNTLEISTYYILDDQIHITASDGTTRTLSFEIHDLYIIMDGVRYFGVANLLRINEALFN